MEGLRPPTSPQKLCGDVSPSPITFEGVEFVPACTREPHGRRGQCRWSSHAHGGGAFVEWPWGMALADYAICGACPAEGPYNGEAGCPFCSGPLRSFDPQADDLPPGCRKWPECPDCGATVPDEFRHITPKGCGKKEQP